MQRRNLAIELFYILLVVIFRTALSRDCSMVYPYEGDAAVFNIARDCDLYSASYIAPSGSEVSIFPRHGTIGNNRCTVYQGLNATGILLGIYTEFGYNEGMMKTSGSNEIFMNCDLINANENMVFLVQPYVADCKDSTLGSDKLPARFVIPADNNGLYLSNLACQMVVRSNRTCTFTVTLGPEADISETDGLFVSSDDPFKLPVRFVSDGSTIVGAKSVSYTGKFIKVDFATGGGDQRAAPDIVVSAVCQDPRAAVACGDKIVINVTDLGLVHAGRGDTLYISNSATYDISNISDNCKAVVGEFALFQFDISECQSGSRETEHMLIYTFTVHNTKSGYGNFPIFRQATSYHFQFTCSYPSSKILKSKPQRLIPVISSELLAPEIEMGELSIVFNLYATQTMGQPLPYDTAILVPSYIYGKVELSGLRLSEQRFILEMEDCWITPSGNPNTKPRYNIIENGCKVINVYDPPQAIMVSRNHEARFGSFQFQSFVWTNVSDNKQALYAHCHVKICDNKIRQCIRPSCSNNNRRRRDIERVSIAIDETVLTAGPLIPSKTWNKNCSKCSDLCHIHDNKAMCSCYSERELTNNGQDCQDKPEVVHMPSTGTDFSTTPIFVLIAVVVALVLIIAMLMALLRPTCCGRK